MLWGETQHTVYMNKTNEIEILCAVMIYNSTVCMNTSPDERTVFTRLYCQNLILRIHSFHLCNTLCKLCNIILCCCMCVCVCVCVRAVFTRLCLLEVDLKYSFGCVIYIYIYTVYV